MAWKAEFNVLSTEIVGTNRAEDLVNQGNTHLDGDGSVPGVDSIIDVGDVFAGPNPVPFLEIYARGGSDFVDLSYTSPGPPYYLSQPPLIKAAYISGGNGHDTLGGGRGNDEIDGDNGRDEIHGNLGNDDIDGGNHNDKLWGDAGDDELKGGNGRDEIWGGSGRDEVEGGNGNDSVHGGSQNDDLEGNDGRDRIWGDGGRDELKGGRGNDSMWGGSGRDTFEFGDDDFDLDDVSDYNGDTDRIYDLRRTETIDFTELDDVDEIYVTRAGNSINLRVTGKFDSAGDEFDVIVRGAANALQLLEDDPDAIIDADADVIFITA